jgi:hypothetical protein
MTTLTPAHQQLIEALADLAVEEYLTAQAAPEADPGDDRTERALPRYDQAA